MVNTRSNNSNNNSNNNSKKLKVVKKNKKVKIESVKSQNLSIYNKFQETLFTIGDGSFFEDIGMDYPIGDLVKNVPKMDLKKINKRLDKLKNKNFKCDIVKLLLNDNISDNTVYKILEYYYKLLHSDMLSPEYNSYTNEIKELMKTSSSKQNLISKNTNNTNKTNKSISTIDNNKNEFTNNLEDRLKNINEHNLNIIYKNLNLMQNCNKNSDDYVKYYNWISTILSIPFNTYNDNINSIAQNKNKILKHLNNIRKILDKNLAFLENPKDEIINIIAHLFKNPKCKVNAIGLGGPPGIGKTAFIDTIAEALDRPVIKISLGGNSDANLLNGHGFTYVGSKCGKIVNGIINSKIMNPIFAFDELDKISGSLHGKEVINTLIHLIDLTTNNKYNVDNYLGEIELDLSQSLFIFTYNDVNKIDKILLDRIHKINISNYTMNEKKYIINKHIIPQSFNEFAFNSEELIFTDSAIEYLLNRSSNSLGLRAIKHNINIIISRINTLLLAGKNQNIIKLDYKCLYDKLQLNNKRIEINKNIVEIILNNINKEEEKDDISYKMMYI